MSFKKLITLKKHQKKYLNKLELLGIKPHEFINDAINEKITRTEEQTNKILNPQSND